MVAAFAWITRSLTVLTPRPRVNTWAIVDGITATLIIVVIQGTGTAIIIVVTTATTEIETIMGETKIGATGVALLVEGTIPPNIEGEDRIVVLHRVVDLLEEITTKLRPLPLLVTNLAGPDQKVLQKVKKFSSSWLQKFKFFVVYKS